MSSTAQATNRRSPIKTPERCPSCNSRKIAPKGSRSKKFEIVRLYRCRACGRSFTPGPRAIRNKTYPVNEILEALTTYNRGHSLEDTSQRLSSRYGHRINPATISRWLAAYPRLITYRRLRARGLKLFTPPQIIRTLKLYHRQVYEFAYHRAKLAFLRDGTLDDKRYGDTRFAGLADFLETAHQISPHELFRREDSVRASQLAPGFLNLDRLTFIEKQNAATEAAALIIPSVGSNHDRHSKLQRFMLANDSATIAVEFLYGCSNTTSPRLKKSTACPSCPKNASRPVLRFVTNRASSPDTSISCKCAMGQSISLITNLTRVPTSRSPSSPSTHSR
jgi:transposase-like protein